MQSISRLAAALAVVAAVPATQAAPLITDFDPADFDANVIVVNTSGASAQRSAINQFSKLVCDGGVFREYRDDNGTTVGGSWRSYFCQFAATWPNGDPNPLAGQKVLFNTRTKGGSVWGVIPVQENYSVEMMNILSPTCSLVGSRYHCTWDNSNRTPTAAANGECDFAVIEGGVSGRPVANGQSTICVRPDLGASDEEPSFFTDENLPALFAEQPDESKLVKASLFGVQFAPEVTLPVYRVLQEAQGILNPGDPDDYDNPNTAPSLTKEQLSAIFSGEITNWNQIATPVGTPWPDFNQGSLGLCRRTNGSGTQAGATRYLFSRPGKCGGTVFMVTDNTAADGSANGTCDDAANGQLCYVENSGSDDVNTCLDRMNGVGAPINTFFAGIDPTLKMGAIGFNAIEKPSVPGVSQWRFVKVDGVAPTTENGVTGEWDWAYENSMQAPATPVPARAPATATVTAAMLAQLGDPAVVDLLGTPGNWALRDNGFTPSTVAPLVGFGSRLGNSCNEVIIVP
ncbi:MAG: substrate-binding domain-containing protein [Gammaproteobacteria bacterium]